MRGPLERAAAKSPGGVRPPAFAENRSAKKNYAQNLSTELAMMMADCLRPHYPRARITPRFDGSGLEFTVGAKLDSKRTDVGVWDDAAGLILGVSIKTYSFRDFHGATKARPAHLGRYVRNVKRNDMELRDEADILHRRQPYAVLFALFFMPRDAAWDGATGQSSFAHAAFTFRKRTGRTSADAARTDLFEKVHIGLFDDDGGLEFFDVENAPPRNQPPEETVSLLELIAMMLAAVVVRNEGVAPEERYAPDRLDWSAPPLAEGIEMEEPLDYKSAIESDGTDDEEP
jgi:hypothetical protein